jgi:hypothetical protein
MVIRFGHGIGTLRWRAGPRARIAYVTIPGSAPEALTGALRDGRSGRRGRTTANDEFGTMIQTQGNGRRWARYEPRAEPVGSKRR